MAWTMDGTSFRHPSKEEIRACGTISFAIIVFQTASDIKGLFVAFQNRSVDEMIFLSADSLQFKSDTFLVFLRRR